MRSPSLLSCLCKRVRCLTALGKKICHQKPSKMEYPPAPSRQLSSKDVNVGIRGMMWAIGVSLAMLIQGEAFCKRIQSPGTSSCWYYTWTLCDEPDGQLSSSQSLRALFGPLLNKEKYQFWVKDRYPQTWEMCLQVGTCSQSRHMQWMHINASAGETPNGCPLRDGPIFP
jgi:hypothetical protein